jgi:prepilin-type N-terminal cleavage/methylation domain-containing protein
MFRPRPHTSGVTMIELLIVTAIIGLLIVATTVGIRQHLQRANDADRKSDLKKISTALEQYYNDHNGYPASLVNGGANTSLISCGNNTILSPYMKNVPCDPNGGSSRPYLYIRQGTAYTGSRPSEQVYRGYRLLTVLTYKADPQIKEVGCPSALGCGGNKADGNLVPSIYNFGLAANAQVNMNP